MEINTEFRFMVDFTLPEVLSEEFMNMIPYQRAAINDLLAKGKLVTYALSLERSKLWAIFSAKSEMEVMKLINDLPLSNFLTADISLLTFHNTMEPEMPSFSIN